MRRSLLAAMLMLVMPSLAHAVLLFADGFEGAHPENSGWAYINSYCNSSPCPYLDTYTPTINTDGFVAMEGTQVLKGTYNAAWNNPQINDTGIYRYFSQVTETWLRYKYRTHAFTYNTPSTKHMYYKGQNSGYPNGVSENRNGSRGIAWAAQGSAGTCQTSGAPGGQFQECDYYPNMNGGGNLADDHTYCVLEHVKFGTPGNADGTIEIFVDGVQTVGYFNLPIQGTPPAYIDTLEIFKQDGDGVMFYDDVAMGTARADVDTCGGGTIDTQPPTAVTSLAGVANGSGFPSLTWVNGTDNVVVTGQNITRCTGTACTPSVILVSPSGLTTSYTDTTVTAGTVYGYAVNDFDAVSNQGPYAATVYVTAANSTNRTTTFSDTFTRADDATGLGANYDGGYTGFRNFQTLSNAVQPGDTTTTSLQTYNGAIGGNDQFISMIMPTFGSGGTVLDGELLVRFAAPATVSGYKCLFRVNGSFTSAIRRIDSGAQTNLITENSHTWGQSSQPSCEANGTTLNLYDGSTLILTATDATYASGRVGLLAFNATATSNIVLDNLVAGTLGAPPAPPIIATVTPDATGATLTYGATTPTQIRVASGSNCCGQFSSTILPISSFPGGRYTNTWVGGLTYACFYAIDSGGVENDLATAYICQSLAGIAPATDTTPITFSNLIPSAHLPSGTTSTGISASINKTGACRYGTSDPGGTDFAAFLTLPTAMSLSGLTVSSTVSGLTDGSTHTYYARCNFTNSLGTNIPNPTSQVFTVIVDNPGADLVAPSNVTGLTSAVLGQTQATLTWNAATAHGIKTISGYFVYSCFISNCSDAVQVTPSVVPLTTTVISLLPSTTYYFCVKAVDSSNVLSAACSNIPAAITTAPIARLIPPSDMTNLRTQGIFQQSTVLTWDQGTSPYGSVTTTIEQSPAGCTNFQIIASQLAQTILAVTLAPNTTYCFRGKFSDSVIPPNVSVNYSNVLQVTTNAQGLSFPRTQVPFPGGTSPSIPRSPAGPRSPRQ